MHRRQAMSAAAAAGVGFVFSRTAPAADERNRYELTTVFNGEEAGTRAWVVLNGKAFKTLASKALREYIGRFKPEVINYDRGCTRIPELPSDEEVKAFTEFCAANKIKLVIPPEG